MRQFKPLTKRNFKPSISNALFLLLFGVLISSFLVLWGCSAGSDAAPNWSSSSSSDTTATSGVSTIAQVPKATSPVVSSSSSARSFSSRAIGAYAGLSFKDVKSSDFNSESSRALCEVINMTKYLITDAAQTDQILCYVQEVLDQNRNTNVDESTIYNGNHHTFYLNMDGEGDNDQPMIKFKVDRNTGEDITSFEMYECFAGSTASPAQSGYRKMTIDDNNQATITSKNIHSSNNGSGKSSITVTGTLSSGKYTSKTATAYGLWTESGQTEPNQTQMVTLTQGSDYFIISGFQLGSYGSGSEAGTFNDKMYGKFQLIDNNTSQDPVKSDENPNPYSPRNWNMGNGSLKFDLEGTYSGGIYNPDPDAEAWSVDDTNHPKLDIVSEGLYYSDVVNATLPDTETVTIEFDGDKLETWDCTGDVEATLSVDMTKLSAQCSHYTLRDEGDDSDDDENHINCYDIIDN